MSTSEKNGMNGRKNALKDRIHEVIFESETSLGKKFNVILLVLIIASVLVVMLESVDSIRKNHETLFLVVEWAFTILFTIEYVLRLYAVRKPWNYAKSFFGIIDLLAILPTYLSLFIPGTQYFLVIRALRLMRIFRVFKLWHFLKEGRVIGLALRASMNKIMVFLFFILILVTIIGSIMYFVEGGPGSNFTSIPRSVYWAIVTLTTVGYGDIAPVTEIGQLLAAAVMIMGYAIIAVPTGIVTGEMINAVKKDNECNEVCRYCSREGHDADAEYCKYCGEILNEQEE